MTIHKAIKMLSWMLAGIGVVTALVGCYLEAAQKGTAGLFCIVIGGALIGFSGLLMGYAANFPLEGKRKGNS